MSAYGRHRRMNCHQASARSVVRIGAAPTWWINTASRIAPPTKSSGLTNLTVHIVHEGGSLALSATGARPQTALASERRARLARRLRRPRRARCASAVLRHRLWHPHVDPPPARGGAVSPDGAHHRARWLLRHPAAHCGGDRRPALAETASLGGGATRADGGCGRPAGHREMEHGAGAPGRVTVGLSERTRAESRRLLRTHGLAGRDRLQAAASVAHAGERALRADGGDC